MIALENIEVVFNRGTALEHSALRGIDLTIREGEFVTIIGGNGAGKSTLMNVLSGDQPVCKGKVMIDELDVTKFATEKRARWVSRVFQDPMLGTCANLTVEENLALALGRGKGRGLRMTPKQSDRERFRKLLARLGIGLEKRLTDSMGLLSGGQRQAISLLMSTLQPSKILLLDEHTAALDPKMAKKIMGLTQELIKEQGLTALMITHSMTQALEFGNRTILMHEGKIAKDLKGEEREQLKPAELLALFEL